PCILAHRVQLMDEAENAALELELCVERGVERDGDVTVSGHRPPLLPGPLDEHFFGSEVVPRCSEPAAGKLFELVRLESRPNSAELLPELGAEHGQVRLHAQLRGLDVPELDLLHA